MNDQERDREIFIKKAEMIFRRKDRKNFEAAKDRMLEFNTNGIGNPLAIVEELNTSLTWRNSPIKYVVQSDQIVGQRREES